MSDSELPENRGGAREGAGRKPKYDEPMVGIRARVPESHRELLRQIGDGEISEGLRKLIEEHREGD